MKKLVALAVVSAFAVPVYADISIDGNMEMSYLDESSTTASSKTLAEDGNIRFRASSETANGIKATAIINLESDGSRNGAGDQGLVLSGAFGTVKLGDTSGAVDSLDAADFTNVVANGLGGRTDSALTWALPKMVDGLSVLVSYSPTNGVSDEAAGTATAEVEGFAIKYSFGSGSVAVASEDVGTTSYTMYQVRYSMAGLGLVYENNEAKVGGAKTDNTQWSLTYALGDTTLAVGNNSVQPSGGAKTTDQTVMGIYHDMGAGLQLFLETADDDKAAGQPTATAIGVAYSF